MMLPQGLHPTGYTLGWGLPDIPPPTLQSPEVLGQILPWTGPSSLLSMSRCIACRAHLLEQPCSH